MEIDQLRPILQSVVAKDAIAFKKHFEEIMVSKAKELVDAKKEELHQSIFNTEASEEE